jgi:hypothetical protein
MSIQTFPLRWHMHSDKGLSGMSGKCTHDVLINNNVKGEVVLCLNNYDDYAMKMYLHIFWTSILVGGELSASRPCRFTSGERASIPIG